MSDLAWAVYFSVVAAGNAWAASTSKHNVLRAVNTACFVFCTVSAGVYIARLV